MSHDEGCGPSAVPVREEDELEDLLTRTSTAEATAPPLDLVLELEFVRVTPWREVDDGRCSCCSPASDFSRPTRPTRSRSELDRLTPAPKRDKGVAEEEEDEGALAQRLSDSFEKAGSWEGRLRRWAAAAT